MVNKIHWCNFRKDAIVYNMFLGRHIFSILHIDNEHNEGPIQTSPVKYQLQFGSFSDESMKEATYRWQNFINVRHQTYIIPCFLLILDTTTG